MAYLDIHFTDIDALTSALTSIKCDIEDGIQNGSEEHYGTIVAWKLNLNAR